MCIRDRNRAVRNTAVKHHLQKRNALAENQIAVAAHRQLKNRIAILKGVSIRRSKREHVSAAGLLHYFAEELDTVKSYTAVFEIRINRASQITE